MGINGLHRRLKQHCKTVHLEQFQGTTCAIDGSGWMYKALFAEQKARQEQEDLPASNFTNSTKPFERYVRGMLELLLENHIKPILVFDGDKVPAKAKTYAKRAAA